MHSTYCFLAVSQLRIVAVQLHIKHVLCCVILHRYICDITICNCWHQCCKTRFDWPASISWNQWNGSLWVQQKLAWSAKVNGETVWIVTLGLRKLVMEGYLQIHHIQSRIQKFRKGGARSRKGGAPPKMGKKSRILGLKSWVLLTFDGKFRTKRGGPGPLGPPS
jgi:hypothetical protein